MNLNALSKILIFTGLVIVLAGIIIWLGVKIGLPLGRMPGDLHLKKEKYSIYFPIVTSIVISFLLTIFLNLIFWLIRK